MINCSIIPAVFQFNKNPKYKFNSEYYSVLKNGYIIFEFIEGTDFRLHVLDEVEFACEILSDADDYRYPNRSGATSTIRASKIPEEVVLRCRALVASMGLHFAGVDLRRAANGSWYCFEVNPSPGFSFYEEATGQPISRAVARMLASA